MDFVCAISIDEFGTHENSVGILGGNLALSRPPGLRDGFCAATNSSQMLADA